MSTAILLRVTGPDFCAGAVFDCDPPICVRAADKISLVFLNRGLNQCIALCRLKGWRYEVVEGLAPVTP